MTHFFLGYKFPFSVDSFQRLGQIISNSKSSNPCSASSKPSLVTMSQQIFSLSCLAVPELINLPKSSKPTGPDRRVALYSVLAALTPAEGVSSPLLQAVTILLPKKPHENAISVLAAAFPPHVVFLLCEASLPSNVIQFIAKEMNNSKPAVRKGFVGLAGAVFLNTQGMDSENGAIFAKGLVPAFEICLKTVAI